ncbi:MAG: hypothetical protein M0R48_01105 [Candidatus Omnitrophica bacterium]|jgi:hypothetical protein|nr:hypothetical protein [Candidatus Omnitrophota bacterium]
MALIRFFKALFKRSRKKKIKKHSARGISRKKIKKAKNKPKHKLRKIIKKKAKKKSLRRIVRKTKKAGRIKKKKTASKRVKMPVLPKEKEIGIITHYFDKISVGIIKLKYPLAISEHIHIKGKNTDFTQVVSSMQYNHKDITLAERGLEIGIRVIEPVHENDIVSKV